MDLLAAMRLFTTAVDAGSFSEAGRRLGLTPSSVSRQIGGLEAHLCARLLHRTTRRLALTEAGRLFDRRARHILAEAAEATRAVADLDATPRGTLKVNLPVAFGTLQIAPLLPRFLAETPGVELDLTFSDDFVDVIDGGYDVVLRIGALKDSSLIARKLADNRRIIYGSPEYLARHGRPERPEDLAHHRCLLFKYQPGEAQVWRLSRPEGMVEVAVGGPIRANNSTTLTEAAVQGAGLAMLSTWLVGDHVRQGRLVPLFTEYRTTPTGAQSGIFAVYPPARQAAPKVRAFIDFLTRHIPNPPPWEADALPG